MKRTIDFFLGRMYAKTNAILSKARFWMKRQIDVLRKGAKNMNFYGFGLYIFMIFIDFKSHFLMICDRCLCSVGVFFMFRIDF